MFRQQLLPHSLPRGLHRSVHLPTYLQWTDKSLYAWRRSQIEGQENDKNISSSSSPNGTRLSAESEPIEFEYRTCRILQRYSFKVERIGGPRDRGIDFRGVWALDPLLSLPVVGQCKYLRQPVEPKFIREFEGVIARENSSRRSPISAPLNSDDQNHPYNHRSPPSSSLPSEQLPEKSTTQKPSTSAAINQVIRQSVLGIFAANRDFDFSEEALFAHFSSPQPMVLALIANSPHASLSTPSSFVVSPAKGEKALKELRQTASPSLPHDPFSDAQSHPGFLTSFLPNRIALELLPDLVVTNWSYQDAGMTLNGKQKAELQQNKSPSSFCPSSHFPSMHQVALVYQDRVLGQEWGSRIE